MTKCSKRNTEAIAITTTCMTAKHKRHFYFISDKAAMTILAGENPEKLEYYLCKKHLIEKINHHEMFGLLGSSSYYTSCILCEKRIKELKYDP